MEWGLGGVESVGTLQGWGALHPALGTQCLRRLGGDIGLAAGADRAAMTHSPGLPPPHLHPFGRTSPHFPVSGSQPLHLERAPWVFSVSLPCW